MVSASGVKATAAFENAGAPGDPHAQRLRRAELEISFSCGLHANLSIAARELILKQQVLRTATRETKVVFCIADGFVDAPICRWRFRRWRANNSQIDGDG
jgi:hypothetical protein